MPESADDRILYALKSRGAQTAGDMARRLRITPVAVRQQLERLRARGLVAGADRRGQVGRPKRYWSLTGSGHGRFPDTHADLTVDLLASARAVFGETGVERLIEHRAEQMLAGYRSALAGAGDLGDAVHRLTRVRDREGYMARCRRQRDGSWLLVENHCPVCAAARQCQGLCRSELEIFRQALGPGATVARTEHLLAGARRCAYRIEAAGGAAAMPGKEVSHVST